MKRKFVIVHENDAMKTTITVAVATKQNHGLMRYEVDDRVTQRADLILRALGEKYSPSDITLKKGSK